MPHLIPTQYFDDDGDPLAGGSVEFYLGSTSTASNLAYPTYDDAVAGTNTLGTSTTLDSAGRKQIWFTDIAMKYIVKNSLGVQVGTTIDDLFGSGSGDVITVAVDGSSVLSFPDNNATAMSFKEGSNTYLVFDSTDSNENIRAAKQMIIPDDVPVNFGNVIASPDSYIKWDTSTLVDQLLVQGGTQLALEVTTGLIYFNIAGSSPLIIGTESTFSNKIIAVPTTTSYASIKLPHGSAPSSPVDGDLWTTSSGLFVRINGSTVGPLS